MLKQPTSLSLVRRLRPATPMEPATAALWPTQSGEPYMAAVMGHTVPILSPLCHQRRVYSTALQKPVVTLDIQRLPRRVDPCLNARQVLQGAIEKKLKLEAATLSALGLSPA